MTPATKAPASAAKRAAPAKASPKTVAQAAPSKNAATKSTPPKKAAPDKAPAAKKAATAKASAKAPATKKVEPAKAPATKKVEPAKAPTAKVAPAKVVAKVAKAPVAKAPPKAKSGPGPYASDTKFLDEQRVLLDADRAVYQEQAIALKAEADSLAQEREPGDVQFDEESGEGGTVTVDRERDLALSAQAGAAVVEIDEALERVGDRSYGACERCLQPILKARLRALPYARLCVACKSGGLSRR
jgi:DnaK suppressor protein